MLRLATADLRHEWILTLCLILAIASVVAPLLILSGLKYGTIATLRDRLMQDPVFREIRPVTTKVHRESWFEKHRKRADVGFLVPTILPASSILQARAMNDGKVHTIDLVPTAPGDPMILHNGGKIPGAGQAVLTGAAAKRLDVEVGDRLEVRATRTRGGRRELGETTLEVLSVLGPGGGSLERIYAPLPFVLDVESFKEGMAVPSRGWNGGAPEPYLSFDGMVVLLPEALTPVQLTGLAINTGVTLVEPLDGKGFQAITGLNLPENFHAYDLRVQSGTLQLTSYNALRKGKLRGRGAILLPYVRPMEFRFGAERRPVLVAGVSLSADQSERLSLPSLPWGQLRVNPASRKFSQILLPPGFEKGQELRATVGIGSGSISFPVRNEGVTFGRYALVPASLLATLRTGQDRMIRFDQQAGKFVLERTGFRGFRLYAATLDDVVPLANELQAQGLDVSAKVAEIERIQTLNRGLTRIFWLVAVVGIGGGIAVLVASLYATVQRKRRELGLMRLLGLTRFDIFRFPIYQGLTLAVLGVVVATVVFLGLAAVINHVFAGDLEFGQRICYLPPSYLSGAFFLTTAIAFLSSLYAAWKTTEIDPAEAMREE